MVRLALILSLALLTLAARSETLFTNPVRAGDFPDPSIIRVGTNYYATATFSEWTPHFPILHSTDLVNWRVVSSVFPEKPAWAANNFWAPELVELNNRFFVYYVARQKSGPLSVAVASADRPEGPYTDHGPLVAQAAGSIDAALARDENGKLHMLWKEDGNSRGLPTIIWAQPIKENGTELTGARTELIRNDTDWEGRVVEGPFVVRRGKYFYLFYSGAGCCGPSCNYALGVARSRSLLGPWEKNPLNPILSGNNTWKCPGHGSIVEDPAGRHFLLYHAYSTTSGLITGRQPMLDEVTFADDDWPRIAHGTPSLKSPSPFNIAQRHAEHSFSDNFENPTLNPEWNWPVFDTAPAKPTNGQLHLRAQPTQGTNLLGGILGRLIPTTNLTAQITVEPATNAIAGLALLSDRAHGNGIATTGSELILWTRHNGRQTILARRPIDKKRIHLMLETKDGQHPKFFYSPDGEGYTQLRPENSEDLPKINRYLRIALTVGGSPEAQAHFDNATITAK